MSQSGPNKKVANSLVALSSAAVLAVYSAGYFRTRAAADRFALQTDERRPPPAGPGSVMPVADIRPILHETPAPVTDAATPSPSVSKQAPPASALAVATAAVVATTPSPAPVPAETSSTPAPVPVVAVAATPAPAAVQPATSIPAVAEKKPEPPPAQAVAPPVPPKPVWKDGTYTGWGTSRHGDIQARVIIESGRIASATIAQCLTRYSCDVIDKLPPQVAQRQSPETDFVSGATQSTNAFYYGVVEALSKAK